MSILSALLLGGAIRVVLSPDQLNVWVQDILERESPQFAMSYSRVNLSLSKGYLPRFGLEFSDLAVVAKDPCVTRSEVSADRLYLPLSISGLFVGKLQFNTIWAGNLNVVLRDRLCNKLSSAKVVESEVLAGKAAQTVKQQKPNKQQLQEELSRWQSFFQHRWEKEVSNTRLWMQGLRIDSVRVLRDKGGNVEERAVITDINIEVPKLGDTIDVSLAVEPKLKTAFDRDLKPLRTSIEISKELMTVEISGQHKEGLIDLVVEFTVATGLAKSRLRVRQFPAREVVSIAKRMGWTELELDPRLMWFSCLASSQGAIVDWQSQAVKLSECALEGDLGKVSLSEAEIFPVSKGQLFAPFAVEFVDLSLSKLLVTFGRKHYSGMMTETGTVTGVLLVDSPEVMKFKGQLRGLEFQFSRLGRKALQKIPLMAGDLQLKGERVSGLVETLKVDGGEFAGEVSVNFDKDLRSGVFQVKADKLKLAPGIQRLLVNGEIDNFEVYGQGRIENSELVKWEGQIGISKVVSKDWELLDTKIKSGFSDQKFKAVVRASELNLDESNDYQQWLRPLLLKYEGLGKGIPFRKLYARLEIDKDGGRWTRAKASVDKAPILFSSHGEWQKLGELKGEINVDFPKLKLLRWELTGSLQEPRILPSSQMLKELAKKDPSLEVPDSVSPLDRLNFYKELWSNERIKKIKSIGKRVLDTAKSMLPQGSPKDSPATSEDVDQKPADEQSQ